MALFSSILTLGFFVSSQGVYAAPSSSVKPLKVVIDPGHGGKDRGAVHYGLEESVICLEVAKKIRDKLSQQPGVEVILTRDSDEFMSLKSRTDLANSKQADVFLSIHANWSFESKAHGAEFYIQNQLPPDEESARQAARENGETFGAPAPNIRHPRLRNKNPEIQSILEDLEDNHRVWSSSHLAKKLAQAWYAEQKPKATAIRQAPFRVVSTSIMPSILIELGFLSNAEEAQRLSHPTHQEILAERVARGLIQFKDSMDKSGPLP